MNEEEPPPPYSVDDPAEARPRRIDPAEAHPRRVDPAETRPRRVAVYPKTVRRSPVETAEKELAESTSALRAVFEVLAQAFVFAGTAAVFWNDLKYPHFVGIAVALATGASIRWAQH